MKVLITANDSEFFYNLRFEVATGLRDAGQEVFVAAEAKGYEEEYEKNDITFLPVKTPRRGTNPFADLKLLHDYKAVLRKVKPDIVFTNSIKPNVYMGMAAASRKIPYVTNVTGLGTSIESGGLLSKLTVFLYKQGMKKAQAVFFQNESNKSFLTKKNALPKNAEIILLPGSGVNLIKHCYEPYPDAEDGIRFLFVGRLMQAKGILEFLKVMMKLHEEIPEVTADVVGAYDDPGIAAFVEEAEKTGAVRYHGRRKDVHSFMKNAHALVLPSYHEGMANVLLEAAATGRPVLASDIPGCRETFLEGESGISFLAQSQDALEEAMRRFIAIPQSEKEAMGRRGRVHMETNFDRNRVIDRYLDEINKVKEGN